MPSAGPARSEHPQLRALPAALTVLAGLVMTLVALTFGAAPLLVPGIGFMLLGLASIVWVWLAAAGGTAQRLLPATRVLEGEVFEAKIEVRLGRFGAPGAIVRDQLAGVPIELADRPARGDRDSPAELLIVGSIERRGRHIFEPPSLVVTDPLGLSVASRRGGTGADEVLVLPRTEPVRWRADEQRRVASGAGSRAALEPAGAGELDGLRGYQQGTPAARIHWSALARGAGLLERRLIGEREPQPLIVLDARVPDTATGRELLDVAVRAAASLTLELARHGGCSLLLPGARGPVTVGGDLTGWPSAHARLALVQPSRHAPAPSSFRAAAAGGPVIWVATGDPLAALPLRRGAAELILVAPVGSTAGRSQPALFEVAGCVGFLARATTRASAHAARRPSVSL